jgi:hypothetical protein
MTDKIKKNDRVIVAKMAESLYRMTKSKKSLTKSLKWPSHCHKNGRVTVARDKISKIYDEI